MKTSSQKSSEPDKSKKSQIEFLGPGRKEKDLEPVEKKKENMGNCGGLPDDLSYLPTCGRLICPGPRRPSTFPVGT